MDTVILELKDLRKQYPGVLALRECSFDLRPGEVHALVGENGAGKSTLIKISTGVIQPTSGTIRFRGEPVVWSGPRDAIANGIGAVYQDPAVFPDLSVAENIFMNHQPHGLVSRRIFWREMHEQNRGVARALECAPGSTAETRASYRGGAAIGRDRQGVVRRGKGLVYG